MGGQNSGNRHFSIFFFTNLLISLIFSLLVFFMFIRLKATENSFSDYLSKVLTNFQANLEDSVYNDYIRAWFNPQLKSDEQEAFQRYKLSILAKTLNTFFKNLLVETQNRVVTQDLQNFILYKKSIYLGSVKENIKEHIRNNPDLREVSTYDLNGKKIFGLKYKNRPDYAFSEEILSEVLKTKNLLLKHGDENNLILLSVVENAAQKPFLIVSQSIDKNFFNRILSHLDIDNNVFYIKDSKNFVLFDNYQAETTEKAKETPFRIFNALTTPEEQDLKINLNDISYSLGTIVQKNNIWGNIVSIGFIITAFLLSFFCIDLLVSQVKKLFFLRKESPSVVPTQDIPEMTPVLQNIPIEKEEVTPLTLEQYLLKKKNTNFVSDDSL